MQRILDCGQRAGSADSRELARQLGQFPATGDELAFASPGGSPLHHGNFRRRVWLPAVAAAGLTGIHLHDLRHAGNTFTANAGANLRELMDRMGHSSTRAALIYLHGGDQRQRPSPTPSATWPRRRYANSPNTGRALAEVARKWHTIAQAARRAARLVPGQGR